MTRQAREELRVGRRRIIRVGQTVRIRGERGTFVVRGFDAAGTEVSVYGGPRNHAMYRTFAVDRIGARPRMGR